MPGIALDGSEDLPSYEEPQPTKEATPMKDQMQYIVIEGRKPQDGAKPTQALLILPKWISPTLACAGIVGRVIELTDGNIIEQGALPVGEQETLESVREDMRSDAESQQEHVTECPLCALQQPYHHKGCPNVPVAVEESAAKSDLTDEAIDALAGSMPGGVSGFMKDWGYRQFAREVQARCSRAEPVEVAVPVTKDREFINRLCLEFGAQPGDTWQEWLREQLEELAQFRKDRPEALAKLQAAEDNLAAWRDAAGANPLIQQYTDEKTGQITRLAVAVTASRDASDDVRILQETIDGLEEAGEHMREEMRNMHAQLLERPTMVTFTGPVTIVQGNPPSVFGPDLGKSAE